MCAQRYNGKMAGGNKFIKDCNDDEEKVGERRNKGNRLISVMHIILIVIFFNVKL